MGKKKQIEYKVNPPQGGETLSQCLAQAKAAAGEDNSSMIEAWCKAALEIDPVNLDAWTLLAKFGGWDFVMYTLDMDEALNSAKRALGLTPEGRRYAVAADVYAARKKQISNQIEEALLMPSYTGAKNLHEVMQRWLRFLVEIPCLSATLIESELTLCDNLCQRSKRGVMPADRMVYTAYATFNGKETYGDTFRKALAERADDEFARKDKVLADAKRALKERQAAYRGKTQDGALSPESEARLLERDIDELTAQLGNLIGLSDRGMYQKEIEELERQKAKLKPYKVFNRRTIDTRIEELTRKIAQIDADLEESTEPLRAELDLMKSRLAQLR